MPPHNPTRPSWRIEPMTRKTSPEVLSFINKARITMFPELSKHLRPDTASWLHSGTFLTARTNSSNNDDGHGDGDLIATIGFVPYNHRFPQFTYPSTHTVEVVRLFVHPAYRRSGLGTSLFAALRQVAEREYGVECFYLHTHGFLEGAVGFWRGLGFVERGWEGGLWETVHMDLVVAGDAGDESGQRKGGGGTP